MSRRLAACLVGVVADAPKPCLCSPAFATASAASASPFLPSKEAMPVSPANFEA